MNTIMFVAVAILVFALAGLVFWKNLPKVPKPKARVCPLDGTEMKTHYYVSSHGQEQIVKFPLLFQIKAKVHNPENLTLHHTQVCPACGFDTRIHVPDEASRQSYIEHCRRQYQLHHTPS